VNLEEENLEGEKEKLQIVQLRGAIKKTVFF